MAQASKGYAPDTPRPSWAEQWPDVWLDAVEHSIAGVMREAGAVGVRAVCISSLYGGSGIPVDGDMRALHPCLIWMDRRAEAQVAFVKANIDLGRLGAITGNGVDSYYGFTKMLWLRDERPEVWSRIALFLPPNAYVIQRLTGEIAVDHSSAGNIGGVYDIGRRAWSAEMLEALGIPLRMMPARLVASTDIVGGLSAERAARLGLDAGTPVVAGGVDAAVATYAAGVTAPGQHVAMIGTSMCWGYVAPRADAAHGLIAMPYVVRAQDDLYVFGGAGSAGACVTWFREQFCAAEMREGEESGRDPHAILEEAAARVAPGAGRHRVPALPHGGAFPGVGRQGERRVRGPKPIPHPGAPVSRRAGKRELRAAPQHGGGGEGRCRARRPADRGGRRGALRLVDADHRRRHRLSGLDHPRGRGGGAWRRAACRTRRRAARRWRRGRVDHLGRARPARSGPQSGTTTPSLPSMRGSTRR